ncbi:MAG: pyridoxamine 5'-phosphate oxidase family protein [Streptosporangiaceae bacterium]|jgi:transcriptional regulator with XRE-family HTH domain
MTASQETQQRPDQPDEPDHGSSWPAPPYPGDLSRRVTQRRQELKLTRQQVAARANVSLRYLEFLENYPGMPTSAVLRQLAAALQTSPAALLGAGMETAPGGSTLTSNPVRTERLSAAECHQLISPGGIGRIGFPTASGTMILPVNYAIAANTIVIRAGSGSVIAAHGDGDVSFQVDHIDEALEQAWSVLVQGQAHRVLQRTELAHLQRCAALQPWPGGEHDTCIRIAPHRISGRRIVRR